jgi:glycosyltransferase involved in cell wall biosynthesis
MAVGNACVASTADGQGEVLTHEKDALLFAPGDIDAMARHVLRLLDDQGLMKRLRQQALTRIQDFDMKRCLDKIERKYEEIV